MPQNGIFIRAIKSPKTDELKNVNLRTPVHQRDKRNNNSAQDWGVLADKTAQDWGVLADKTAQDCGVLADKTAQDWGF